MHGPRESEKRRGNRQDAEFVVCCDYQRLSCGRVLDQLKHAKQGKIIAAELVAARRRAVVCGTAYRVYSARLVRDGRYAIPDTRSRDSHEHRKRPHPQDGGCEELAMAVQSPRHNLSGATR